jgi:hypothetical protein
MKPIVDTHHNAHHHVDNLDINNFATIVKIPLDMDRQGITYANTTQSPSFSGYDTQLSRG